MKNKEDEDEQLTECTAPSSSALQYQWPTSYHNVNGKPHQAGSSRVADYFAVLGTGSTLTRKQKAPKGDKSSLTRNEAEQHLEEECARLQRWYREIANVQLVGADPLLEEIIAGRNFKATAEHPAPSTSPIINAISQAELDGYEIIRFTRGNFNPFNRNKGFSQDDSILNTSSQLDMVNSNHSNYSMYSSASNSATVNPEEMIWEANIHSKYGIHRDVLLYKMGHTNNNLRVNQSKSKSVSSDSDGQAKTFKKLGDVAARIVGKSNHLPPKQAGMDQLNIREDEGNNTPYFFVAYRRRLPDENDIPAIADIRIMYLQLPISCISNEQQNAVQQIAACKPYESPAKAPSSGSSVAGVADKRSLSGLLWKRSSTSTRPDSPWNSVTIENEQVQFHVEDHYQSIDAERRRGGAAEKKFALPVPLQDAIRVPNGFDEVILPSCLKAMKIYSTHNGNPSALRIVEMPPIEMIMMDSPYTFEATLMSNIHEQNIYTPVLAVRRMRIGEEERWREDPGIIEISMSYLDMDGNLSIDLSRITEADDEENEYIDANDSLLGKTKWQSYAEIAPNQTSSMSLGLPVLIYRRNVPFGFCDTSFTASVLDRFPEKDYRHLTFLQEELPLFCYPTGIKLIRRKYRDLETPDCFSFIVKNERGEEIHVSALSFEEPLPKDKLDQLERWSYRRQRTCLAHRCYWECNHSSGILDDSVMLNDERILTGFDEWITLERKAICVVSRYPYISAFRQFLTHLYMLSKSHSEIPIERYISHLLLSVPVPKPGGQSVLLPLSTCATPVLFSMPPAKDFPLLDLSYHTLFGCLDVPTVVTIALGFLVLERGKVILVSKFSALVTDSCELLRSLLFPFEICAPYVPRLTEPFRSCLDFPGAIFAGIHDDSDGNRLAAQIRQNLPEETILVDLDTGELHCNGDRAAVLKSAWSLLPPELRISLVEDVETLCLDAHIVSGQEALPPADIYSEKMCSVTLDDRAIRDAFFRYFCRVLSGYENYLRFPDVNFLVSGEEWFDTQSFVAAASPSLQGFLGSLVTTQLFQSFIQRRTESSDFRCMLLDECLAVYQRDGGKKFGRKSCSHGEIPILLVDQCTSETMCILGSDSGVTSTISAGATEVQEIASLCKSFDHSFNIDKENFMTNREGDVVMFPFLGSLPSTPFDYTSDGYGRFPERFDLTLASPATPDSYDALDGLDTIKVPILTRSGKEIEDAVRGWNMASSLGSSKRQRKCMWQLPKLTASHFFGAYSLCIPTQVAQPHLSISQQSGYLARAFGVLRLLRHRQRIVADEAAYRALIVACGRVATDRRAEIVGLFGLMRQQGIVPSSVTLGQYTSAIAEGFRKRNTGGNPLHDETLNIDAQLNDLDDFISVVEGVGKSFARRSRATAEGEKIVNDFANMHSENVSESKLESQSLKQGGSEQLKKNRYWKPVSTSSSFVPVSSILQSTACSSMHDINGLLDKSDFKFVALWSRTSSCASCGYSALDEEIQASWDRKPHDYIGSVPCPKCSAPISPMLGYQILSLEEALRAHSYANAQDLPPQLKKLPTVNKTYVDEGTKGFAPYLNPFVLRTLLERCVEEKGEEILDRDALRSFEPRVFWNFWWYCSRFSFPLPLPISPVTKHDEVIDARKSNTERCRKIPLNFCAFSSWDKSIALRGCVSGAKAVISFLESRTKLDKYSQFTRNPENSLLQSLSLQSYARSDWEHQYLSQILVELVSASNHEKQDLTFAVELLVSFIHKQKEYRDSVGDSAGAGDELDCYRTLLYLVRYQCTSAFHVFFPTKAKPCRGYHFWCAKGTPLPPFDRMYREAAAQLKNQTDLVLCTSQQASDLSLGFRSIFGHII